MNLDDLVEFKRTIWKGRRGYVIQVTPAGMLRVLIPGTNSATEVYAPSALKLVKGMARCELCGRGYIVATKPYQCDSGAIDYIRVCQNCATVHEMLTNA